MDHIPLPTGPPWNPPVVPCLDKLPYDQLSFDEYPARQGWDISLLLAGDFSQRAAHETAAFLQNWLYFGVLYEVLGDSGHKSNFSAAGTRTQERRVTTRFLDARFSSRLAQLKVEMQTNPQQGSERVSRLESVLKQLSFFCCHAAGDNDPDVTRRWPLPDEVDLSIRILGSYFSAGLYEALWASVKDSFLANLRFGGGPLPRSRMVAAGWCPSDVSMVMDTFSPTSLYYVSFVERKVTRDHSLCSSLACVAGQVEESGYMTAHTVNGCTCAHVGPPIEKIIAVIDAHRIPLISIKNIGTPDISLEVQSFSSSSRRKYVAFSHVWADGLGNQSHNTLPLCQVARLHSLVQELEFLTASLSTRAKSKLNRLLPGQAVNATSFWIDTLCVPVDEAYRSQRSLAISMMKDTYEMAESVLVLDTELQNLPLSSPSEAMMRISLSGWMRRLWTLQEGVLAKGLYVKFRDGILDTRAAKHTLQNPTGLSGAGHHFNSTFGSVANNASQFYVRMASLRQGLDIPVEPRKLWGTRQVISFHDKPKAEKMRNSFAIIEALVASRYRTTSRQSDEYICIASLLGWNTKGLGSSPAHQRMRYLLSKLESLPQGILFAPGPRNAEMGWKWAVTRFGNPGFSNTVTAPINDARLAERSDAGLTVEYPGIILPSHIQLQPQKTVITVMLETQADRNCRSFEVKFLESKHTNPPIHTNESLCILFYEPSGAMRAGCEMAAALVSVPSQRRSELLAPSARVLVEFKELCQLRMLEAPLCPVDNEGFSERGYATIIHRKWTVQ